MIGFPQLFYEKELKKFSQAFDEEIVKNFIDEFNDSDAIYGEDAGEQGEFVFAVKNKKIISQI
jgi:hypothetical protein